MIPGHVVAYFSLELEIQTLLNYMNDSLNKIPNYLLSLLTLHIAHQNQSINDHN
jgi:hypothetical protein